MFRDFVDLWILPKSFVYCDPPYKGKLKINGSFNHDLFWDWVREQSKKSTVLISELSAPNDFICLWETNKAVTITKTSKNKTNNEKIFKWSGCGL